jgi:CheY-like chemotaxis protein
MDNKRAVSDPEQLRLLLITHEKTIRYALRLLDEGEFLEATSVLNAQAMQLTHSHFDACPQDIEQKRTVLLGTVERMKDDLKSARQLRNSVRKTSAELSG